MLNKNIEIINKLGLHARASSKLVELANKFKCEVWIFKENKKANAKSIMTVMMLSVSKGNTIKLVTDGIDEHEAMEQITKLIAGKFGEQE